MTSNRIRNFCFTLNNPQLAPQELLKKASQFSNLRFIIFQFEIGLTRQIPHFQGYLELNQPSSFKKLNSELFANLAHLESRQGTQAQAIAYCTDKSKSLVMPETFTYGTKKIDYSTVNSANCEIPSNREEQWIYIEKAIISDHYQTIAHIHQDFPYLVIHHANKLQDLLNQHHPILHDSLLPAKVIWMYGKSGAGKSCYTDQLLFQKLGYQNQDVVVLKSDLEHKLWFNLGDENKKVLVVEEVRAEWPKYNSLLNWIDKKSFLPVKGSQIRNNFELIIINSLKSPFEIYQSLPIYHMIEPLRRIYNGQVLLIEKDYQLYLQLKQDLAANKINQVDFKYLLKPIITDKTGDLPDVLKEE